MTENIEKIKVDIAYSILRSFNSYVSSSERKVQNNHHVNSITQIPRNCLQYRILNE